MDFLYRWAILERRPNHIYQQPTQQVTDIFLTALSSLTSHMIRIRNLHSFMYRQHLYDLGKRRSHCLMTWLIMLGFMDLTRPRVCQRSTSVLYIFILCILYFEVTEYLRQAKNMTDLKLSAKQKQQKADGCPTPLFVLIVVCLMDICTFYVIDIYGFSIWISIFNSYGLSY